jgi:GDP-fucose transporter C1
MVIAKRVAPLTFVYVGMLVLNNLCLKYVEVTFYQVRQKLELRLCVGIDSVLL